MMDSRNSLCCHEFQPQVRRTTASRCQTASGPWNPVRDQRPVSTQESNTLTVFQLEPIAAMNCLCRGCSW